VRPLPAHTASRMTPRCRVTRRRARRSDCSHGKLSCVMQVVPPANICNYQPARPTIPKLGFSPTTSADRSTEPHAGARA
jgi:hypothetical protein